MIGATAIALVVACALLLIGFILRVKLAILRRLYLPASVVAGLLGFAIVELWTTPFIETVASEMRSWPSPLIAIVFAGMF